MGNGALERERQRSTKAPAAAAPLAGNRLRNTLVVAEIALTVVLLAAAGLLLRSYVAVLQTDPGFNPKNMLVASTVLPSLKYADHARRSAFYAGVLEEVKALPGVEDAAYANFAPLTFRGGYVLVTIEGAPPFTPETMQRYIVSDRVDHSGVPRNPRRAAGRAAGTSTSATWRLRRRPRS